MAGAPTLPPHLSSDHDPLFEFHRWNANLRILDVTAVHASLDGLTPACKSADANRKVIGLSDYQWQTHCRGLYQLPIAA